MLAAGAGCSSSGFQNLARRKSLQSSFAGRGCRSRRPPFVAATLSAFTVSLQRWDCNIPTVTLALPLATFDQSVFLFSYPYYNFKSAFWPVLQKTIEINRLILSTPLLRPDLGELAKPDTKNGQDFRLAQSAQAISSSLFNLNTSQMSLIRS